MKPICELQLFSLLLPEGQYSATVKGEDESSECMRTDVAAL